MTIIIQSSCCSCCSSTASSSTLSYRRTSITTKPRKYKDFTCFNTFFTPNFWWISSNDTPSFFWAPTSLKESADWGNFSEETYFSSVLLNASAYSCILCSSTAFSYSKILSCSASAISSKALTKVFMLNTVGCVYGSRHNSWFND